MNVRITAIAAAVLILLLPLSLCCMPVPQHACCKARCAMAPDAAPLVAVRLAAIVPPSSMPAAIDLDVFRPSDFVGAAAFYPRFNPMATIQLRI
ncbi:MAG: hypothetical protein QOH21_2656 [Acidobacteriota bacterium]|jgi:hypothetical protein|nr:hypothetical protein [Acidobacteriota bacterium]